MANGYYELVELIGHTKADAVRRSALGQYIRVGKSSRHIFERELCDKDVKTVMSVMHGATMYFLINDERDSERKEQLARQIKALDSKGISRNEIATLLGVSYSFVAKRLKR